LGNVFAEKKFAIGLKMQLFCAKKLVIELSQKAPIIFAEDTQKLPKTVIITLSPCSLVFVKKRFKLLGVKEATESQTGSTFV
jgi:hypothetical protein